MSVKISVFQEEKVDDVFTVHCHTWFFLMKAGYKCGLCFLGICVTACFLSPFCETCLLCKGRLKFRVTCRSDPYLLISCDWIKSAQEGFMIS